MTKEELQKIFLSEVDKLNLRHPVVALEEKTGYTNGIISEYLSSKKNVSEKFFKAFCKAYKLDFEPLTNPIKASTPKEVITLGKHAPSRLKPHEYKSAFEDWEGLPMYNTPITASFIASYRDEGVFQPQYYFYDPRFRDCDFGAIITGDSMHSEIRHGDFIACKEVVDMSFVVFGDIYYVVAKNGLETCKYLNADPKDENNYLLVPKNDKLSPSPIKKEMILRMYKVRGIVRGY
jgi:transcriptional regulator with XRE-family HTH domain